MTEEGILKKEDFSRKILLGLFIEVLVLIVIAIFSMLYFWGYSLEKGSSQYDSNISAEN